MSNDDTTQNQKADSSQNTIHIADYELVPTVSYTPSGRLRIRIDAEIITPLAKGSATIYDEEHEALEE